MQLQLQLPKVSHCGDSSVTDLRMSIQSISRPVQSGRAAEVSEELGEGAPLLHSPQNSSQSLTTTGLRSRKTKNDILVDLKANRRGRGKKGDQPGPSVDPILADRDRNVAFLLGRQKLERARYFLHDRKN